MAHAANHLGSVRLHPDGSHEVLAGVDPVASEDPMAFLPYEAELAAAGPRVSTDNAYPYAAQRILSLFGDADRSPDVAVVHTPRHWFVDEGGHAGRARLAGRHPVAGAAGACRAREWRSSASSTTTPGSSTWPRPSPSCRGCRRRTCATRTVPSSTAAPSRHTSSRSPTGQRRRVVGILWDGAHCGDLLHLAEAGELPGVARLIEHGLALRGGAVAEFPSVTLTNHTSILTGVGPGRHGVLGNVYFDRALQERVVPNDAETWHRSAEWLRPGVRTVFEMVNDHVPQAGSPRTASVDEAIDRGADYGTMALLRAAGGLRVGHHRHG